MRINIVIRNGESGNTDHRLAVSIIFHFRCWRKNKRAVETAHQKNEPMNPTQKNEPMRFHISWIFIF